MDDKPVRFEDFRLLPGQPLQLEFDGYTHDRDKSLLLGYRAGHSIIISTPIVNNSPMALRLGIGLAVRLFAQQMNSACAFRSEVTHISRAPYAHLHLAMPASIVMGEVRKTVRAAVNLICSVHYSADLQQKSSAMIRDLSLGGARLTAKNLPVMDGEQVTVTAQVSVSGVDRIVKLEGIVRTVQADKEGLQIGVQFLHINDSDKITLHAYVLSHLYER